MLTDKAVLEQKGEEYVGAVIDSQQKKGLRASGYSAKNTRFEVAQIGTRSSLVLLGPAYYRQQAYGRRPSGQKVRPWPEFIKKIELWMDDKGISIPKKAAGGIAYNILNNGIPVPNPHNPGGVLSEPLNAQRITTDLKQTLTPLIRHGIKARLIAP